MKNILSSIITSDNYTAIIAISFIAVLVLFTAAKLLKKRNITAGIITVCFMSLAAGAFVSSLALSIPYMEADFDAYTAEYTDSLIGDHGIDSSMVNLNFNY